MYKYRAKTFFKYSTKNDQKKQPIMQDCIIINLSSVLLRVF